ncbi:tyramine/octopamine receptor [Eurytemora carolleeae]|uniref:tyramine/octopamine receptor n=1 Tax=Eurytemora carolleeae TaxID=1294199 RepID=UPI000C7666B5|nr:tyramine/octopamine receptor [Eurytemora carolleeae]|eukprot:XP_023345574.1 tyramine/octopamine receptor-like [Eurytemora affinis]
MFWVTLDVGFCSASIYSLIGISIDRFYAVYRPVSYVTRKRNTLTTNLLLIFSWLMALLISLPMFVEKEGFSNWPTSVRNNSMEECIPPVEPASTGYVLYAGLLAFIFPSLVLICLYAVIAHKMRETQQQRIDKAFVEVREEDENHSTTMKSSDKAAISKLLRETSKVEFSFAESSDIMIEELQGLPRMRDDTVTTRKSQRESRTRRKYKRELNAQLRITIMMGVIISTFAVCWTPFAIMFISFPFSPDFWFEHYKWIDVITWIGYVNSCLNPVIYAIMNKQIRRGMIAICSGKRR